ncbi:glycine betaine ABC transporter substrate-binding protein [Salmonella enterica subsp. enterica serovar Montevideo]
MFFALLVGIPSGILLSRPAAKGFAEYVMQIFNVGNTLPPLAVLALAMVIIGIGDTPAIVALFLASLLPIVRNTYAGLCSVPASLIEAANGIGMTKWQRLRQVELPNAWPVMLSGIRIATAIKLGWLAATLLFSSQTQAAPLVLATKSFTEQHILSAMTVQYLQKKGFQVQPQTNIAAVISRNAMVNKQIDITWEYTGTSLIIFNRIDKRMSPQETYDTVKRLDAKLGLVWLKPADMNNTYAFAMQRKRAESENITTISQMVAKIEQVRQNDPDHNWMLGLDLEFAGRSDGMKPLQQAYQMQLDRPQIRQMDPGLVYNAVRDGLVDAGLVYTTDGRVKGFDLKVLEDDKGFFPSYAVTPVVRKEVLEANPGLDDALNTLSGLLNNDVISTLNAQVDIEHRTPQQVAHQFLQDKGLL